MTERFVGLDPAREEGDVTSWSLVEFDRNKQKMKVLDAGKMPARKEGSTMGETLLKMKKYRDDEGNVYGIEQSVRNKRWVVIRVNAGGNRKGSKEFAASGHPGAVQQLLDAAAERNGWKEVPS